PEEVGDWWLVRRKGFNVHTWRAKCRCGHGHDEHDPVHKCVRCRCGCARFTSNFACLACDKLWEDHETLFESAQERMAAGRPVGEAFRPLAGDRAIREAVFPGEHQAGAAAHARATAASCQPNRLRPAQVPRSQAEKSVQIMHESSGGAIKGQDVANRYGRVPAPPKEWLFMGGSPEYNEAEALEAAQAQYQAQMEGRAGRTAGVASATLPARAKSPQRASLALAATLNALGFARSARPHVTQAGSHAPAVSSHPSHKMPVTGDIFMQLHSGLFMVLTTVTSVLHACTWPMRAVVSRLVPGAGRKGGKVGKAETAAAAPAGPDTASAADQAAHLKAA
ncbi:hypothetical protein QJQ45_026610, partial [Haematococcus lacustris]